MKKENDDKILDKIIRKAVNNAFKNIPPEINRHLLKIKARGQEIFDEKYENIQAQSKHITKLIQEYLQTVEEVKNNKKLSSKEKLTKLLTPLIQLNDIYTQSFPSFSRPDNNRFFVDDTYIDMDKEVNVKVLKSNPKKYSIIGDTELNKLGLLNTYNKNVYLSEEYKDYLEYRCEVKSISGSEFNKLTIKKTRETPAINKSDVKYLHLVAPDSGCTSLSEIYELWLPKLNQQIIKSKDLLDQILVTYTIKRALNGDKKAVDKLCSLFETTAEAVAVIMDKRRSIGKDLLDLKQDAQVILRLLIGGFSPKTILDSLMKSQNKDFLKIPKWVEKFYLYWFSEEVPHRIKGILNGPSPDPLDAVVLLNPFTPIIDKSEWRGTPKAVRRFNSFSYRPNKKTNLYTWLFGIQKTPIKGITSGFMQGRFPQMMSDVLDMYVKREIEHDFSDEGLEDEDVRDFKIRSLIINEEVKKDKKNSLHIDDVKIEKAIKTLIEKGASRRDAEIFIKNKIQGFSQTDLAKEYSLSRMTIYRILKYLSSKHPIT